jgi:phytoene synthase
MSPDEYCQQKATASGSSFYYSFLFLPADRRRAITALYAFCREVDDVVDEDLDPQVAQVKLAWWRQEVADLYAGNPHHPVALALQPFLKKFRIERAQLEEIIAGMAMDLTQTRYLDFIGLERYCYHVAGAVGLLAAGIFGYTNPRTLEYAKNLGTAFQLTNIIRDVGADLELDRVYLPQADLRAAGVRPESLAGRRMTPELTGVLEAQYRRAKEYYAGARGLVDPRDRRQLLPAEAMAHVYEGLLDEIRARGYPVLSGKVSLPKRRKLTLALRAWLYCHGL